MAAQFVGIVAMIFNIFSYQQKTQKQIIAFQLVGGALFAVNFFMLGAVIGGIMNTIGTLRAIVYLNKKRFKADHPLWLIFFISLYVISYILTFTVFAKEFTLSSAFIEVLPVIGMTASNIGYCSKDAKTVRRFGLIASTLWLIYNIFNVAIGAIICEVMSLVSIVIGTIRYDIKSSGQKDKIK